MRMGLRWIDGELDEMIVRGGGAVWRVDMVRGGTDRRGQAWPGTTEAFVSGRGCTRLEARTSTPVTISTGEGNLSDGRQSVLLNYFFLREN